MYTFFLSNNQYDDNGNRIENKTVSTSGNEVVMYFPDRLHIDENKKYEIRVTRASMVYCVPNISKNLKNNKLTYTFTYGDLTTTRTYTFIHFGLYSLDTINLKMSLFTSDIDNGGDPNLIYFAADESTSRIYVIFSQLKVNVDASATNSILILLGFTTAQ